MEVADGEGLAAELNKAAEVLRKNQQSNAATTLRSAVAKLDALAAALTENEPDAVPELAKPKNLKATADQQARGRRAGTVAEESRSCVSHS